MSLRTAGPVRAGELLGTAGRVVLFAVLVVVARWAADGIVAPLAALLGALLGVRLVAYELADAVALVAVHVILLRQVERRPWGAVGLGETAARPPLVARGLLIGAAAIGVPALVLVAAGALRVQPAAPGSWSLTALRDALIVGPATLWEELLFRGYLFALLREATGSWAAIVTTGVLFGLAHLRNPGAGPLAIATVTLAGVLLGALLVRTGSLYAAWAAHAAWNWTLAALLHSAVSGAGFDAPGYRTVSAGPAWLTGGAWGPEGGAAAAAGIGASLFYLLARRVRREEHA